MINPVNLNNHKNSSNHWTSVCFRSFVPSVSACTWRSLLAGSFTAGSGSSRRGMSRGVVPLVSTGTGRRTGGIGTLGTARGIVPATLRWSVCLDGVPARLGLLVWRLVRRADARHVPPASLRGRLTAYRTVHCLQRSLLRFWLHLLHQCFLHTRIKLRIKQSHYNCICTLPVGWDACNHKVGGKCSSTMWMKIFINSLTL